MISLGHFNKSSIAIYIYGKSFKIKHKTEIYSARNTYFWPKTFSQWKDRIFILKYYFFDKPPSCI